EFRQRLQFMFEFPLLDVVEYLAGLERDIEDIDNLARSSTLPCRFRERLDVSGLNNQTECREQSTKDRKLGEVVEPDNDDLEFPAANGIHADPHTMARVQTGGHPN